MNHVTIHLGSATPHYYDVVRRHRNAETAAAFAAAISAGRLAMTAGIMPPRDMSQPSTPVAGTPFFDLD